jgi:hypothetical protein
LIGGCPIAAALFELDDCEGPAREYVAKLEQEWRGFLEALVIRSVELGHLVPETDVSQFIWELCGIYLAHHSFTRFHHDPGTNQRAKHALEALLRRFEPQTSMSQEK